mgnify:CR=1 FL=1
MQLLRLTIRKEYDEFSATYNGDIVLPPNSKIAVQSASINTLPTSIIIGTNNNRVNYQIREDLGEQELFLSPRTYEAGQIEEFLSDLEDKLNESVDFDVSDPNNKVLGLEWKTSLNGDNKVEIKYEIGRYNLFETSWNLATGVTFTNIGGGGTYKALGGDATAVSDFSRNALLPYPIAKGSGFVRARTRRLEGTGAGDDVGFVFGVYEDGSLDNDTFNNISKVKYGFRVNVDGTIRTYTAIIDGVLDNSVTTVMNSYTQDSVNNETMEVEINAGFMNLNIYRSNGDKDELFTTQYFLEEDLRPCFAFFGTRPTTQVDMVRATPSPYGDQPAVVSVGDDLNVNAPPRPARPNPNDKNYIIFQSPLVSTFLGFSNQRQPVGGELEAYTATYTADNQYFKPQEADAMIIQIQSLQVESYDSYSDTQFPSGGQRANILSVIPETQTSGKIVYEPPYLTFLDLNNREPISLRNLDIRIFKEDY